MKVKTIRLAPRPDSTQAPTESADPAMDNAPGDAAAIPADDTPAGLDAEAGVVSAQSRRMSSLFGSFALVATLCVLTLVALQVLEYLFYGKPPSLWPGQP